MILRKYSFTPLSVPSYVRAISEQYNFPLGWNEYEKQHSVLISLFNESDECVFAFQASFCLQRGKNQLCISVCVFGKGGGARLEVRLSERARQSVFFFAAIGAGVCMSPSDRTPFPAIKPSKNIPFVSVTAPTHCSHSAMSVDYVALQFTSATDNIISLIMSYGLLPPSDVCSSAHALFACSVHKVCL